MSVVRKPLPITNVVRFPVCSLLYKSNFWNFVKVVYFYVKKEVRVYVQEEVTKVYEECG